MSIWTLIILLLLLFFMVYLNYLLYKGLFSKIESSNSTKEKNASQTVVLFKSHLWNDSLENFALKLKSETVPQDIDFYILLHDENGQLLPKIKNPELRQHVMTFKEADIKKLYQHGFYGMWLSNHWILMWFYQKHKNQYQYFWSIEYDVRISGNSTKLWKYQGTEDFLYPIKPFKDPHWPWRNHYVGGKLTNDTKYYGYLQLARYSNKFLEHANECFESGENGQDEMIMFSLLKRGNFKGSKKILSRLIHNSWSVMSSDSDKHKKLFEESETEYGTNESHLRIFHPIK